MHCYESVTICVLISLKNKFTITYNMRADTKGTQLWFQNENPHGWQCTIAIQCNDHEEKHQILKASSDLLQMTTPTMTM